MKVIHGNFVHTPSFGELEIFQNVYMGIDNDGTIIFIEKNKDVVLSEYNVSPENILNHYDQNNTKIFVPGFIDLHVHSAQYSYLGTGTNITLMEWLKKYAYPSEKKLKYNPKYAYNLYNKLIRRLILNGTTTTQFFGTIDIDSCLILANIVKKYGMRGFIGKVCQDQYSDYYCENTRQSIDNTETFIRKILSLNSDLIHPVITPRFIPNCSLKLLKGLSELFSKYSEKVHIQSHISESLDEIEFVNGLYDNKSDATIFNEYNLLNDKCVMVHAVHCNDKDWEILASKGVGIAHCPLSNAFFAHGSLDVYKLVNKYGINVGLGTDIAGGYSYSILQNMRQAVITNRMIYKNNYDKFMNYKHALYLATYGGAKCLRLHDKIGLFKVGMCFDAVLLDINNNIDIFEDDNNIYNIFEKMMNLSDDRNIKGVWIKGKKINLLHANVSKL